MKCDLCDNEATVREVVVRNGVKVDRHLCEKCAAAAGVGLQPGPALNELAKVLGNVTRPQAPAVRGNACPVCRTTFAEFKQGGQLGCADCYRAFESLLAPLIERWHEGGLRHVGKQPKRLTSGAGASAAAGVSLEEREQRLRRIREELDSAVRCEQYERAAKLRDEMRRLSGPEAPGAR